MRVEHEYVRKGAWAYLPAWDVHRARVFGRCERKTGIAPFGRLVRQVMSREPYRSASRVFWVVDNGSSHRGDRCQKRLARQWPNLIVVHTPIHASWLNQVEIYFSIVQRKVERSQFAHRARGPAARLPRSLPDGRQASRGATSPRSWRTSRSLQGRMNSPRIRHRTSGLEYLASCGGPAAMATQSSTAELVTALSRIDGKAEIVPTPVGLRATHEVRASLRGQHRVPGGPSPAQVVQP